MKAGFIYRLNSQAFHNTENVQVYVDIHDMDNLIDDADTAIVYPLKGAGEPVRLSIIDNSDDPFTPIRATQATIKFLSTVEYSLETFSTGSDNRWYVHIYIGAGKTIFKGFLVLDDLSQEFMPDPNVVTLTATDNIGLLKDVKLTNADGDNPEGKHRIIDYLTWALRPTGLEINMKVAYNIKQVDCNDDISVVSSSTQHFFYNTFLDAKTFETEINECDDCYTVIKKILGNSAVLFQLWGEWWIIRIDEYEAGRGLYLAEFDSSGSITGYLGEFSNNKQIGKDEDIFFSQAATSIKNERPAQNVKLTYKFETPKEVPCNINFERGDYRGQPDPTGEPEWKTYDIDCWTLRTGVPPFSANGNDAFISRKEFNDASLNERYVEITFPSYVGGGASFLESSPIEVEVNDDFDFGYDFRWSDDVNDGTINIIMCSVRLDATDGTVWFMAENGQWSQSNSSWSVNYNTLVQSWDSDAVDEREWRSLDWQPAGKVFNRRMPRAGKLYFMIHWENNSAYVGISLNVQNFSFTYKPYINGTFNQYKEQYHSTSQAINSKKAVTDEVFISDSPKPLFKGALFKYNGSEYELINEFYNAAVFPAGPPDSTYIHTFGEIQLFDVWNQYRTESKLIQFTLQNDDLEKEQDGNVAMAHIHNAFEVTEIHPLTYMRRFILLSFDKDLRTAEWSGVMRQVYDLRIRKDYSNHEFNYV